MRIITRLRNESGVALPVALAVLFTTAGLATVVAKQGIVSTNQSFRDSNAKRAVQAANSGLEAGRYQTTMMQPPDQQCTRKVNGQLVNEPVAGGWCTGQTEDLGDGAGYTMQVSAATPVLVQGQYIAVRTVVSTGTVNGVQRRAALTINANTGTPTIFPVGYALLSNKKIKLKEAITIDPGGLATNGDIELGDKDSRICGKVTYGVGKKLKKTKNLDTCGHGSPAAATQPFTFQPVDLGPPIASNDNARITNMLTSPYPNPKDTCSNCTKIQWNASGRELTIGKGAVLNLSGNVYLICKLTVEKGGTLQIAARTTPLWMYIDSLDRCGKKGGTAKIDGKIVNLNTDAASFILMVAGKPSHPTHVHGKVVLGKDAVTVGQAPMAIYAPKSKVEFKDNVTFKGTIVSGDFKAKKNVTIQYDDSLEDVTPGSGLRVYENEAGSYKECTSVAPTTVPSSGC